MTNQQIIEVLAEREGYFWFEIRHGELIGWMDVEKPGVVIPNYLSSLDALQPILATLTEEEWEDLWEVLVESNQCFGQKAITKLILTMKPLQLATCIVKTIGKWGEE